MTLVLVLVLALMVSAVVSGLVVWAGPVDRPRARGAHASPTATAGGLGIMAGTAAGLIAWAALRGGSGQIAASLGFSVLLGLFGALDDLYDIGAKWKLLVQLLISLGFAVFAARIEALPLAGGVALPLGPVVGLIGTMLWLLVATNAVNFMDGVNGLAAGSLALALAAFAAAAFGEGATELGVAALAAAVAGLGFLPWNFPKARLFQGDAGALFMSFLLASLAVFGASKRGSGPVFMLFAPLALLPLLTDVLLTLLRRARGGRRLLDAHKEHLYQRWFAAHARSHIGASLCMWALIAVCSLAAFALNRASPALQTGGFLAAVILMAMGWSFASRRYP